MQELIFPLPSLLCRTPLPCPVETKLLLCWSLRGRRLHGVRVAPREGDARLDLCPCIDKSPSCSFIPVQAVLPPHRPARRCTHDLPRGDFRHRCVVTPARRGSAIRLLSSSHALGLDQEPLHPPEVRRAGGRNCQNSSRGGRAASSLLPIWHCGGHTGLGSLLWWCLAGLWEQGSTRPCLGHELCPQRGGQLHIHSKH